MNSDEKEVAKEMDQEGGAARDADFSQLDAGSLQRSAVAQTVGSESSTKSGGDDQGLREELEKTRSELKDVRDKYLRALAEAENISKRAAKERSELIKYQGDRILADLLQVLDSLDLALSYTQADLGQLRSGLELTRKLFMDTLGKWGVRAESGLGQKFDPNKFQALSQVYQEGVEPGTIINEMRKSFFYKDRLLRAGEVVVASAPAATAERAPSSTETGENTQENNS